MGSNLSSLQPLLKEVNLPYKSDKQRKYMHSQLPQLAAKWDKKYGSAIQRAAKRRVKKRG